MGTNTADNLLKQIIDGQVHPPTWTLQVVAVFHLGCRARAVPAPRYRGDTVTPPPPLLKPGPACCAADFVPGLPLTPVAIRNWN